MIYGYTGKIYYKILKNNNNYLFENLRRTISEMRISN